jgi:glyoxylase-like metal-dependent hydrolase (beta-lactamase superfamily II)
MRELLPGVYVWDWWSQKFGYDFHGWLVPHDDGNVVVDPVELPDTVLAALKKRGVSAIAITNRNHFRDAARLRDATGARVLVHRDDAAFVREKGVVVDGELHPGERVGPFRIEAADGKSPGEVALYWAERKILLVGDCVVGPREGELGLLPRAVIDDFARLERSLQRLATSLDFDVVLCSDGFPVLSGGRSALVKLLSRWPRD